MPNDATLRWTVSRDLVLSERSASMPLNYFIYPYVEVDAVPSRLELHTRFSYAGVALP